VNERIFNRFQHAVDELLASRARTVLDQFNAVYRRLPEAASDNAQADAREELAQALASWRRILKSIADHVQPAASTGPSTEHSPDDSKYRNRLMEFIKTQVGGQTHRGMLEADIVGIYDRFKAIDELTNKGVHANVALAKAEACAIRLTFWLENVFNLPVRQGGIMTRSPFISRANLLLPLGWPSILSLSEPAAQS